MDLHSDACSIWPKDRPLLGVRISCDRKQNPVDWCSWLSFYPNWMWYCVSVERKEGYWIIRIPNLEEERKSLPCDTADTNMVQLPAQLAAHQLSPHRDSSHWRCTLWNPAAVGSLPISRIGPCPVWLSLAEKIIIFRRFIPKLSMNYM